MAHGRYAGNGGRLRRISAVVGDHVELFGAYAPIFFEAKLDSNLHENPRPAAGEEFLLAGIDDLDRFFRFAREHRCDEGVVVVAGLSTEAAAHGALNDSDIALG